MGKQPGVPATAVELRVNPPAPAAFRLSRSKGSSTNPHLTEGVLVRICRLVETAATESICSWPGADQVLFTRFAVLERPRRNYDLVDILELHPGGSDKIRQRRHGHTGFDRLKIEA